MRNRRGVTTAVLQARMTSTRLPGKVLRPIEGKAMLLRQIERIQRATTLDHIVVATSEDPSDDELAQLVTEQGIDVVRGSLSDVLDRFVKVADTHNPDVIVRLTGDCPLACPEVIDDVVTAFHASTADYLSNTLDPTYPDGLDVEVITADALRTVDNSSRDKDEREHVTLGVYRRDKEFNVQNFVDPAGKDHSDLRWTVDNQADFDFVSHIYGTLLPANPHFGYQEILRFLEEKPDLSRTSSHAARNAALDGIDTGAMRHAGNE